MRTLLPLATLPFLLACPQVQPLHQRSEQRVLPLKAGGQVDLQSFRGPIHVETWDREEVELQVDIRESRPGEVTLQAEAQEHRVAVRLEDPSRRRWSFFGSGGNQAILRVKVPRMANLALATRHGDIVASRLQGAITAHTTHGRVKLSDVAGNAEVETTHGEVNLRGIQGEAQIETSHARVEAEDVGRDLRVRSTHGGVQVRRVGGRADLETRHGRIQIEGVQGTAEVRTSHGPVHATAVQGALRVRTSHGSVEIAQVQGGVDVENSHGPIRARDLKGNGQGIRLRTTHAPITLAARGLDGVLVAPAGRLDLPTELAGQVRRSGEQAEVSLGKGGQAISLETTHARIRVE